MSDLLSPLQGHSEPRVAVAAQGEAGVALTERRIVSLVQVAAWSDRLAQVEDAVAAVTHCTPPQRPRGSSLRETTTIMAIGPGRYLVESADPELAKKLTAVIGPDLGAVTNLSQARSVVRINGPKATWVLSKGLAIDLDPAAFPPLDVAQTAIHEVGVLVRRIAEDSFDLYVFRGFALSFWAWLTEAAAETGYRVDPPGSA
ncbi:sarcosine oxidase subunit gamma [Pelagibius litoralis]|uniref:Sarcosine oxidase subunit gamma n=1 Tax=Pelagibius litoralis TaxID=374515 RepID=A0A967C6D8_9PROT|nr:sarcosine oxidase subunit gamma family protein [Pelagibius litoralis]NIA67407.1 sarcosine oxidase subunit gamma [Pelagibius litoralis]